MRRRILFSFLFLGVCFAFVRRLVLRWQAAHEQAEQAISYMPTVERLETA